MSPPSTFRPRACGCPYEMAMREGPDRLASSSYHESPIRRAWRWTSTDAWLLAAMRNGGGGGGGGGAGGFCAVAKAGARSKQSVSALGEFCIGALSSSGGARK